MGWISVAFAHKFVGFATPSEAERSRLLRSAGVDPQAPVDPSQMLSDSEFFDLLEYLAHKVTGGRSLAVQVGASMTCDEYGAFGLAFKSAVDLAGSYKRVERYGRIITSLANFRLVPGEETSFLEVIPGLDDRPGLQMTNELALAAATSLSREVCHGFAPVAVSMAHGRPENPADVSIFEDHFGCPIHFRAGRDALEVSCQTLNRANRLGDAGISRFFDSHLEDALAELPEDGGLQRRVCTEIAQALSEGVPRLPKIARHLGMSARTLQRRLASGGQTYQSLVENAQRELASRLLRTTDHSIAEVAFLTGFTEQSTFSRAFKRWSGQTPRDHRLRV